MKTKNQTKWVQRKPSNATFRYEVNGRRIFKNDEFMYVEYKSEWGTNYEKVKRTSHDN